MIEDVVPSALAGERVDRIVALMADVSRSAATAIVRAGGVTVGGIVIESGKERLKTGDLVAIDEAKIPVVHAPTADAGVDFAVVYADSDLLVVDKPAGLVVHPGAGHVDGTLVNGLLARYPEIAEVGEEFRPGIVHRLDQGTSGLLIVARQQSAYEALVEMLSAHEVRRRYRALVWGHPEEDSFTVDAPLGRDPQDPLRMAVVASGKEARTHVEVLERFNDPKSALVKCELETGRTHQIRVHLRAIGHPVVGDAAYGGVRSGATLGRPFLHAEELEFDHPMTGEHVHVVSPLPSDLVDFLRRWTGTC